MSAPFPDAFLASQKFSSASKRKSTKTRSTFCFRAYRGWRGPFPGAHGRLRWFPTIHVFLVFFSHRPNRRKPGGFAWGRLCPCLRGKRTKSFLGHGCPADHLPQTFSKMCRENNLPGTINRFPQGCSDVADSQPAQPTLSVYKEKNSLPFTSLPLLTAFTFRFHFGIAPRITSTVGWTPPFPY